jgi:hypothetical protein
LIEDIDMDMDMDTGMAGSLESATYHALYAVRAAGDIFDFICYLQLYNTINECFRLENHKEYHNQQLDSCKIVR